MKLIIQSLIVTLGKIEVRGKENLDMLLGCIQTLEKLLAATNEAHEKEESGNGNGTGNQPEQNV